VITHNKLLKRDKKQFAVSSLNILANNFLPLNRALYARRSMSNLHRSEFLKEVKNFFPEVTDKINQQDGLLSFEVDVFVKFVQNQIDSNSLEQTKSAFTLLDKYYQNGNKALHELIRNAVCENLNFSDTNNCKRSWAYSFLSEQLKTERNSWLKFMGYSGI
jgi:hypothetical protein